ncbi:MAG: hypothetical protein RLZZ592_1642 [Pseudomonadota bacterium]
MLQQIFFLRHATAEDRLLAPVDAERVLVDKGQRQTRAVARFCERQTLLPARLLCSPLVRARDTAITFSEALPDCPVPQVVDWLKIDTPTAQALAGLRDQAAQTDGPLWLVGHEPDLSLLISRLLGSEAPIVRIKKASLTCLEIEPDRSTPGRLLWSIPCALMG